MEKITAELVNLWVKEAAVRTIINLHSLTEETDIWAVNLAANESNELIIKIADN